MISITSPLQPKQKSLKQAIEQSDYSWIGYGGARGGAKSHAVREMALYFAIRYNITVMIFRRFRNELLDNHINPMMVRYPQLRKYLNKSEYILYAPTGRPLIRFGYAERNDDIFKYQGVEYPIIFIDEATQLTEDMMVWLQGSNRDPRGLLPSRAKMVTTMNPGGVGHTYIKRIYIDRAYRGNEKAGDYYFLQAHVWDNIFWVIRELQKQGYSVNDYYRRWNDEQRKQFTLKYSDYAQKLAGLPDHLRDAYLYGDWNVFAGLHFKEFDPKQIIDPFEIPEGWKVIASMDPGFSSPLSFGVQAMDYDGTIYRVGMYYEKGRNPFQHAEKVREYLSADHSPLYPYLQGRMPDKIVSGHDAWSQRDRYAVLASELTMNDAFREQGIILERAITDRKAGWWALRTAMPEKYLIFRNMNNPLVEQLTSVESDNRDVEDIAGKGNDPEVEDHALDEARYGMMAINAPRAKKPADKFSGQQPFGGAGAGEKDVRKFW